MKIFKKKITTRKLKKTFIRTSLFRYGKISMRVTMRACTS